MSIKAVQFVRELAGLTATEKAVAFVLAAHDDHKGAGCWPSMSTVAREAGLENRETASRIVKRLAEKSIVVPQEQTGRPTVYQFNYASKPVTAESHPPVTPQSHPPMTPPVTQKGGPVTEGVTLETETCDSPVTQEGLRVKKGNTKAEEREERHSPGGSPLSPQNEFSKLREQELEKLLDRTRFFLELDMKKWNFVNFDSQRESFMKHIAGIGIDWKTGGKLWNDLLAQLSAPPFGRQEEMLKWVMQEKERRGGFDDPDVMFTDDYARAFVLKSRELGVPYPADLDRFVA